MSYGGELISHLRGQLARTSETFAESVFVTSPISTWFMTPSLVCVCAHVGTHHIEVGIAACVSWVFVEGAVFSRVALPGSVEVIGHDMDEVQVPVVQVRSSYHV